MRWHLARTPGPPLKTIARRIAWKSADWAPLAVPICAVARKPGAAVLSSGGQSPLDFQFELRRAVDAVPGGTRPWLPLVLVSHGEHSTNKITLFALAANGRVEFIIKVPRVAVAADGIAREADALRQARLKCGEIPGMPRVLFSGRCSGIQVVVESPLDGTPLTELARTIDHKNLTRKVIEWQTRLVHTPAVRRNLSPEFLRPIGSFIDGPLATIAEPELIRTTKALVQQLGLLPITCEQRDFSPWNILLAPDGELSVVDWESAEPEGLPALDLVYFLTYFTAARNGPVTPDRVLEAHHLILDASTGIGSFSQQSLEQYSNLVGVPAASLVALRLLCWIVHARAEHLRAERDRGTRDADQALRRSLFVSLWKREAEIAARAVA